MARGARTRYIPGDWNAISDVSGLQFKRSEMALTWDNKLVEKTREFDIKHPQLIIRPRKDDIAVTITRTRGEDPELQDDPITSSQLL